MALEGAPTGRSIGGMCRERDEKRSRAWRNTVFHTQGFRVRKHKEKTVENIDEIRAEIRAALADPDCSPEALARLKDLITRANALLGVDKEGPTNG